MSRSRSLIALVLLLFPVTLAAQSDIGLWVSKPSFDSTEFFEDDVVAPAFELSFDEDIGYGITYTQGYGAFALELGAQKMGGDVVITVDDNSATAGDIDITALTGTLQWRFLPGSRITPYIGGGLAYMTGEVEFAPIDEPVEDDEVDLESQTTWLANAGVTFKLSDRLGIGADVKYIPYDPTDEGGAEEDAVDINPLVFSVGLRIRFGR